MPVILDLAFGQGGWERNRPTPARLKILLAAYPAKEMACWPVSTRVGNVKNNNASLIEPVVLSA
jgi:putative SOS response-associated peptidase YedK